MGKLLNNLILLIYSLFSSLLGIIILINILPFRFLIPLQEATAFKIDLLLSIPYIHIIFAFLLLFMVFLTLLSYALTSSPASLIRINNAYGTVNIHIPGIEKYFINYFNSNSHIHQTKCRVYKTKKHFYIYFKLTITAESDIQKFSEKIQRETLEKLEIIFGITDSPIIEVYYYNIRSQKALNVIKTEAIQ